MENLQDFNDQEQEWLKCAQDFEYFCRNYVVINHPKHGPMPFQMYEFQKRVIKQYESNQLNIISKFRQGGLTTLTVIYMGWMCIFRTDVSILFMSKTDREAIKAGKILTRMLQNIEIRHPWLAPRMAINSHHEKAFADTGSSIEFRTTKAARGQSVSWLVIDEAAFIQGMEESWKDMFPTISSGGKCVVISTVNGLGNWYSDVYHDAINRRNTFNVIDLDYTEHPDYRDPEWVKRTKANMKPREWAQEFERSFLGSGNTYFDDEILAELDKRTKYTYPVKKLFPEWDSDEALYDVNPDSHTIWEKGALWVWEPPIDGREYIIGVDVAEGVGEDGDNSAFQVIDSTSLTQVAEFSSNCISTSNLAVVIDRIGHYYNNALVVVENNTLGNTVLDRLVHSIAYDNIYYSQTRSQEKPGVNIGKDSRQFALDALQDYLQQRKIKINSARLVSEMLTFKFNRAKKKPEAEKGHHDDMIMSLALVALVRDRIVREVPVGVDMVEPVTEPYLTSVYDRIVKEIESISPKDLIKDEKEDVLADENILEMFQSKRPYHDLLKEFAW